MPAPSGAVGSQVSSAPCGRTHTIHCGGPGARPERSLRAQGLPSGGDGGAKRRGGPRWPWPRAPSGALRDLERPRAPRRVRIAPVHAAVVEPRGAWYPDPPPSVSCSEVATRLSALQMPTPQGGQRWHVAAVRGLLRSPTSPGGA
jgi:hypothetical protein